MCKPLKFFCRSWSDTPFRCWSIRRLDKTASIKEVLGEINKLVRGWEKNDPDFAMKEKIIANLIERIGEKIKKSDPRWKFAIEDFSVWPTLIKKMYHIVSLAYLNKKHKKRFLKYKNRKPKKTIEIFKFRVDIPNKPRATSRPFYDYSVKIGWVHKSNFR